MTASNRHRLRIALIGSLAVWIAHIGPVSGHWDRPGPPPLSVGSVLDRISYQPDLDDGADGNAEVLLIATIHQNPPHGDSVVFLECEKSDLNFDVTNTWVLQRLWYTHQDCTPLAPVRVSVRSVELDTSSALTVVKLVTGAAAIPVAFADPPVAAALAGVSLAIQLVELNGDDDLGWASTEVAAGSQTVLTVGPKGSSEVHFTVAAVPLQTTDCDPDPPIQRHSRKPCFEDRHIVQYAFVLLSEALGDAVTLAVEPGNPGNVTPAMLQEESQTLQNLVLDSTDSLVQGAVDSVADFPSSHGIAWQALESARSMRPSDSKSAMARYETAALVAVDALIAHNPDGCPVLYPVPFFGVPTFGAAHRPYQFGRLPLDNDDHDDHR